jgi:hypothetical protein
LYEPEVVDEKANKEEGPLYEPELVDDDARFKEPKVSEIEPLITDETKEEVLPDVVKIIEESKPKISEKEELIIPQDEVEDIDVELDKSKI